MSISYAKNTGLVKMPPVVEIGGKIYRCAIFGNLEVMAANIEDFGTLGTDYYKINGVCYYKRSTTTSDLIRDKLNEGWHPLNNGDISALAAYFGGGQTGYIKALGNGGNSWPGTNESTLNILPHGWTSSNGVVRDSGRLDLFVESGNWPYLEYYSGQFRTGSYSSSGVVYFPLRLARNV